MTKITFLETEMTVSVAAGTELLDLYKRNPLLPLRFGCTQGTCGVCVVEVVEGMELLSPKTRQERKTLEHLGLPSNCRLACQCAAVGGGLIKLRRPPPEALNPRL